MFLPPLQDEDLFLPVGWAGRDHSKIEILDICSRNWHEEMKDNFCLTGILYLQLTNLSLLLGMGDSLCFSSPNQLSSTSLLCMSLSFFGSLSFFDMHVGRFYYVLWWLIARWFMIESHEHNARRVKGRDLMYAPGGAMLCGLYLQGTKFEVWTTKACDNSRHSWCRVTHPRSHSWALEMILTQNTYGCWRSDTRKSFVW